jgi:hypothetical protein
MIVEDGENEGLEPFFDATKNQIGWGFSFIEYKNGIQAIECKYGFQSAQ